MISAQKNGVLVIGMLMGLLSLPLTWMTISGAKLMSPPTGFPDFPGMPGGFTSSFPGIAIDVTGLNGHVTLLVKTPLWLIILSVVAAGGVQIANNVSALSLPKLLLWGISVAAAAWVLTPIGIAVVSGDATLGIGAFARIVSAAAPILCLALGDANRLGEQAAAESSPEPVAGP